jgi:acetyl-CoA acetyltransferase
MVVLQLEDYGFCKPGEGGAFVLDGNVRWPDGRLPVNTHGGNLSEVYLLGMTHVIEGVVAPQHVDRGVADARSRS